MPYTEVMHKWKKGELHSGSKEGPIVKGQKQAVAIMLSEKRAAEEGKKEYQPKKYQKGGSVEDLIPSTTRGGQATDTPPSQLTPMPHKDTPPRYEPEYRGSKVMAVKKGGAVTKHSEKGWRRW
jgi:Family of unknown function (DUF6496)